MNKKVQFFIDDVIWVFRDLTRNNYESLFDAPYMKILKEAYEKYGVKTQLNVFFRTSFWYGNDEFSLKDMTDKYKKEFKESSSWLKLGFHSKEEWPDYPYVNADYDLVDSNFKLVKNEICRFAGEESFAKSVVPHWAPISYEGIMALKDNGIKVTYSTYGKKEEWDGNQSSLPYGHSFRLLHNKKPESGVYSKVTRDNAVVKSLCSYNHISTDEYNSRIGKFTTYKDDLTGMCYTTNAEVVLNLVDLDNLEQEILKFTDHEYLSIGNHEQYYYKDYYAYQKDYKDKIMLMGKTLKENGYTFVFAEELCD